MHTNEAIFDAVFGLFTTDIPGQALSANWVSDWDNTTSGTILTFDALSNGDANAVSPRGVRIPGLWAFYFTLGPCSNGPAVTETQAFHNTVVSLTCVYFPPEGAANYGYLSDGSPVYTGGMDKLLENDILYPWDWRESPSGRMRLTYQGDGNLVLYDNNSPVWASNTAGTSAGHTMMQGDGNLVIYNGSGAPVWSTGTDGYNGAIVVVQENRCALMYHGSVNNYFIPWGTGTCQ